MTPTVGRIVHYKLGDYDAESINSRRLDAGAFNRSLTGQPHPGERGRSGHVLHTGNQVAEGDVLAAVVVRTFGADTVNLKVLLDGNDDYWAISRPEGELPGQWAWPPRA